MHAGPAAWLPPGRVHRRVEVRCPSPFRLARHGGTDGVLRCHGGVIERLLGVDGEQVVVRAAQTAPRAVLLGAWGEGRDAVEEALVRMRFALGVDDDLTPFLERFRWDPLIGPSVRRAPWLRVTRRPVAFEALAWAICEQLIEFGRAAEIERRIVRVLGPLCPATGLRDVPGPGALARCAPARLTSFGLAERRALALVRVAREVSCGRVDLDASDPRPAWERLQRIPDVGRWTIEMLALHGQGRYDVLPAGDLGFIKLLGRWRSGGDPAARAHEGEVRALFGRYGAWAGLAGAHALRCPAPARELLAA